mgnify:FL=1
MRGGADGVGASQPQLVPATILRKNFEFIAMIKPHEVPNRPEFYMIGSGITEAFLNALTIGATCTHEDFRAPCFTNEEIAAAKTQLNAEQVAFDALSVEEQAAHTAEGGLAVQSPPPCAFTSENIKITSDDRYSSGEFAKSFTPGGFLTVDASSGEMTQEEFGTWGFTTAAIERLIGQSVNEGEWQVTLPYRIEDVGEGYLAMGFNCPTSFWNNRDYGGAVAPRSFLIQKWENANVQRGVPNFQVHGSGLPWAPGQVWKKVSDSTIMDKEFEALPAPGDGLFTAGVQRNIVITRTANMGFKVDWVDAASGVSVLFAGGLETTGFNGRFNPDAESFSSDRSDVVIDEGNLPFCFQNKQSTSIFSEIRNTGV